MTVGVRWRRTSLALCLVGLPGPPVAALRQERFVEAEVELERALGLLENATAPDSVMIGTVLNNLGQVYSDQQLYADAAYYYERALDVLEEAVSPWDRRIALTLNNLAFVAKEDGKYDEAMILYEQSLGILERTLGDHPYVASVLENLAILYSLKGWTEEAEEAADRARAIRSGG